MSNTPRTNAVLRACRDGEGEPDTMAQFARTLERENARLREALAQVCDLVSSEVGITNTATRVRQIVAEVQS